MNKEKYMALRKMLLEDGGQKLINAEKTYAKMLHALLFKNADMLREDFDLSSELYPFWANYPPAQRGRMPVGDSIPWTEVGQTSLTSNIIRLVERAGLFGEVRFPGLPSGGDMRFLTHDAFVHLDIKVTGPRDNPNEVVASRNQISGTGSNWNEKGLLNREVIVVSPRTQQPFHPELPPFYVLDGKLRICLTFFLKGVYSNIEPGMQPLDYFELVCVPNGLLLFDGPKYAENDPELIRPGKNDKKVPLPKRRRRIKLEPLSRIAPWRSIQYLRNPNIKNEWQVQTRANGKPPDFL